MTDQPHGGTPFADATSIARPSDDDRFMRDAFEAGRLAADHGDVPIGAAIVLAVYTVIFLVLAYWRLRSRDVTVGG